MKKNNDSLLLAKYFRDFMVFMTTVRQPGTLLGYKEAMIMYCRFLEEKKGVHSSNLTFSHFNYEYFVEWIQWLRHKGNSKPTCNLRISQIRAFLKWLKKKQPQHSDLFFEIQNVELFRINTFNNRVEALSEEAVKVLISVPGTKTKTGLKYTTLMSLLYLLGVRSDEILSIKLSSFKGLGSQSPCVEVIGKGRKKRTLNIPLNIMKILMTYIKKFHGDTSDADAYLFYSPIKGKYFKMSESALNKQMDIYSHRAHAMNKVCPEHVHPHQLRHSYATHSLDKGVHIYMISKLLGHNSVDTTMTYLGITPALKAEAMMKTESLAAQTIKLNWKKTNKLEELFK